MNVTIKGIIPYAESPAATLAILASEIPALKQRSGNFSYKGNVPLGLAKSASIRQILGSFSIKSSNYRSYCYTGFVASVSSFLDYYKYSMQLTTDAAARENLLWKKEAPIFTRVHNSSPTMYTKDAKVENSMIADECVIEGTVINSVIFRGVTVEKGAIVKNSILFQGTVVSKNAELNCIVTDKDVFVSSGVKLSGNDNMPFYVQKTRKV